MLDCGEGTLGQMSRYYGDQLGNVLKKLSCIFISHIHADHHLGFVSVIKKWKAISDKDTRLLVIAPYKFIKWISSYQKIENFGHDSCLIVDSATLTKSTIFEKIQIQTVRVDHCHESYAVIMKHKDIQIAFSGDCRPSQLFAKEAYNSDVLIHEATFLPDDYAEAKRKKHSTISEAIWVGEL